MKPSLADFPKRLECDGCASQHELINSECMECATTVDDEYRMWKTDFDRELRKMLTNAQKLNKQDPTASYHYEYLLKQILGENGIKCV